MRIQSIDQSINQYEHLDIDIVSSPLLIIVEEFGSTKLGNNIAYPAAGRGQLNSENDFPLSLFAPENLIS